MSKMGVLNRKKSGAAGGAAGAEFFSNAEASQLNTLLRGGGAGTSGGEVAGSGSALGSGASGEPSSEVQVRVRHEPLRTSHTRISFFFSGRRRHTRHHRGRDDEMRF